MCPAKGEMREQDVKAAMKWLPLAAAGLAGGVAAGAVATSLAKKLLGGGPKSRPKTWVDDLGRAAIHPTTLLALKRALLGLSRKDILKLLGPPAAAGSPFAAVRPPSPRDCEAADTWYYPLDDEKKSAMALRFKAGRAADATFLRDPALPTLTDQ